MIAQARRRAQQFWRLRAEARRVLGRRGSAAPALDAIGRVDRHPVEPWNEATSSGHLRYREAVEVPTGTATVMCVSCRPDRFDDVLRAVRDQVDVPVRLVFVANDDGFDVDRCRGSLRGEPYDSELLVPPPGTSLGAGLNLALSATSTRWVAKFDDDDLYGPHHLADSLRALSYSAAGIVGKHSYYADVVGAGERVIRFPGNEFTYSGTLAGGTLVIDRERVGGQQFADLSLGEDRAFLAACHRRGISTFAADRFNFVQVRAGHNTWRVPDDLYLRNTLSVDSTDPVHLVDR
ncbi:MAG: hypothetical protein AAGF91_18170 [Actinomycetota bacterium]